MEIINLCEASFVPGFHKHWLHFFYSFSKIMLLLNRQRTYQRQPCESKQTPEVPTRKEMLRSGHHRLPQHSPFLSCQAEEMEAEKCNPSNTSSDS